MFLRCSGRSAGCRTRNKDNNKSSSSEILMRCKLCLMVDTAARARVNPLNDTKCNQCARNGKLMTHGSEGYIPQPHCGRALT